MSITDIPTYFSTTTGVNVTTAQLILSVFLIFCMLLPYVVLMKGKPAPLPTLIILFLGESISLGLGWSPFWIMLMFLVLTAFAIATLGAKGVTG